MILLVLQASQQPTCLLREGSRQNPLLMAAYYSSLAACFCCLLLQRRTTMYSTIRPSLKTGVTLLACTQ